jgi:hypothetical protein
VPVLQDKSIESGSRENLIPVLSAAAFIIGEFATNLHPQEITAIVGAMLQPAALQLPPTVQAVFAVSALKLVRAACLAGVHAQQANPDSTAAVTQFVVTLASSVAAGLGPFSESTDSEVQERAFMG